MQTPVESAKAKQLSERSREIVVQVQDPVLCDDKRSCDPQIQFAAYIIHTLCVTAAYACQETKILMIGIVKNERKAVALNRNIIDVITCPTQSLIEGVKHLVIGEIDGDIQG